MTPPEPAPESASPDVPLPSAAATLRPAIRMTAGPWAWLLRAAALASFLAAVTGVLVAPGLRGLAADRIVDASNRLAWTFAYFMFGLLVAAIILAALQLSRGARARNLGNGIAVSIAGLTMALAAPALVRPLPTVMAAILAVVASLAAIVGGLRGLRAKHTRAVAALMLSFAMAALLRIFAWDLARMAGDNGNTSLYATARGVATAALLLEAIGQMIAAAWLGTRSRFGGQFLSSIAVALAWVLTYGAALGASANAKPWEAAAHIALATATGLPRPYGPNGLGVFLLAASILLAGVAAVQRGQIAAVLAALSLSLIARGTFDVPIHALAATAAALWLMLAETDERAMWQSLLAQRGANPRTGAGREARI